ncbi:gamma-aminobutyric acid receptor-associated protein-like 2 [Xiphophorus hellerii]|nr:gamma-aminobutyric acid receptor-associated protein-like 2 [Xiphophorus hellerii]
MTSPCVRRTAERQRLLVDVLLCSRLFGLFFFLGDVSPAFSADPEARTVTPQFGDPAKMKWMFKEDHSLEHRCVESAKIRNKYPDRVPVIVEKVSGSQIVDIDKRKYLVPSDITVAQFMWIIRKRIQLPSEKAIFLFVDKTVPQSSLTMGQLYDKEKDEDGFLYVAYSGENTFG